MPERLMRPSAQSDWPFPFVAYGLQQPTQQRQSKTLDQMSNTTLFVKRLHDSQLRQVDFALLCGLTQRHVSRLATGSRPAPQWAWAYLDAWDRLANSDQAALLKAARETPWWCQILGVPKRAGVEEIKSAFRRAAKATHPDHGGDTAAFRRVREAYEEAMAA